MPLSSNLRFGFFGYTKRSEKRLGQAVSDQEYKESGEEIEGNIKKGFYELAVLGKVGGFKD